VGYQGVVRRDPEPARRPVRRRPGRRPDRQPWPVRPAAPARGWRSPAGAVAVAVAALSVGGFAAFGPPVLGVVHLIIGAGFFLGALALAPMKLVDAARARAAEGPSPAPEPAWRAARERFDRLCAEYAGYECDPVEVLRLPALADATVPSTARFVDALAEAQALRTDEHPGAAMADRFATAAEHAEQAWSAARDAAGRIRLGTLSPAERTGVERAVKLLTVARETDSEHERLIAYARARDTLAELDRAGAVHLPRAARTALDEAARAALPR
jgi:hypothetical protein